MTMYKATHIIDEAFNEEDIRHSIEQRENSESVCAGFAVEKGPLVTVRFISQDDDNDVAVRILSLFNDIPKADRPRVLKVINEVNCEIRHVKFCLDDDGDINVEFDVPIRCGDDCLGKVACEMFFRMMQVVRSKYEPIVRALYELDEEDEDGDAFDMHSFEDFMRHCRMESDDDSDEAAEAGSGDGDECGDGEIAGGTEDEASDITGDDQEAV